MYSERSLLWSENVVFCLMGSVWLSLKWQMISKISIKEGHSDNVISFIWSKRNLLTSTYLLSWWFIEFGDENLIRWWKKDLC